MLISCWSSTAQPKSIRQEINRMTKSSSIDSLVNKTNVENQKERSRLDLYLQTRSNRNGLKARSVDNGMYLRRIDERGTPIYYTSLDQSSRAISHVDEVQRELYNNVMLKGQDMIIGVIDGDILLANHQEFIDGSRSRVRTESADNTTKPEDQDRKAELKAHATHVGGIIGATGKNASSKGILPEVEMWSYNWDKDDLKMISLANDGVLVSNHSYGIASMDKQKNPLVPPSYFGTYNYDASQFDDIAYTFPYYQPVVAAGNDGRDYMKLNPDKQGNDLLLGAANAKNSIVVAAVGYNRAGRLELADFSSSGPTNDYRIKPNIAANGINVYSSIYAKPFASSQLPLDNLYGLKSGTSMAAPAVSGIITLWQQWALTQFNLPLRSATIRALTIHTANKYQDQVGPNHHYGYGIINAAGGINLLKNTLSNEALLLENTLLNGQGFEIKVELIEDAENLVFTLSWTDPSKGYSSSFFDETKLQSMLVNDLDISVVNNEGTHYPWRLTGQSPDVRIEKGVNAVDNIEKIEIPNAKKGIYTVVVSHKGKLMNNRQDFSLIASNEWFGGLGITTVHPENVDIIVWPNPVQTILNIEIPDKFRSSAVLVQLFSLDGKLVSQERYSNTNYAVFPMEGNQSGAYIVVIHVQDVKKEFKIIKI